MYTHNTHLNTLFSLLTSWMSMAKPLKRKRKNSLRRKPTNVMIVFYDCKIIYQNHKHHDFK